MSVRHRQPVHSPHSHHAYRSVNMIPGKRTPGKNGFGITKPWKRNSHAGKIRSAPSVHPKYQSGCAGIVTFSGRNGPYSQIGLI